MELDAEKLKLAMVTQNFNVASLARAAGLSPACVNGYLNHGRRVRLDSLGKLIKALNVSLDDIVKEGSGK